MLVQGGHGLDFLRLSYGSVSLLKTVILFGEFAECAELNGAGDTVKCLLLWIVVNGPLESG